MERGVQEEEVTRRRKSRGGVVFGMRQPSGEMAAALGRGEARRAVLVRLHSSNVTDVRIARKIKSCHSGETRPDPQI